MELVECSSIRYLTLRQISVCEQPVDLIYLNPESDTRIIHVGPTDCCAVALANRFAEAVADCCAVVLPGHWVAAVSDRCAVSVSCAVQGRL